MRKLLIALLLLLCCTLLQAQTVHWTSELKPSGDQWQLVLKGRIAQGYFTHGVALELESQDGVEAVGLPYEEFETSEYKGENVMVGRYVIRQNLDLSPGARVSGTVTWTSCSGDDCFAPEEYSFCASAPVPTGHLWRLILEAILWGLAMLLTPCVFPMVPMTVSFFIKQSGTPAQGRFRAFMYGLFIVLLYTVPISVIIGLTWALGGSAVTADIFNWLSTHWLPNILFFLIFMAFAASFFGAFEIVLPSSWTTGADKGSSRGGLGGVFFLALTLVLVSFSCTGPIVGTVLIKSTQGEFWVPMVTMLSFSVAFALPFALLAFFPSVLQKLPRSGSWLGSVKIVLGFLELALGLKFLSVADQTYHWHILPREVYLAIWIVVFVLLGMYLLGLLHFNSDAPVQKLSVGRKALAVLDFAFVLYLFSGLYGAPLKALSGYLPPAEHHAEVAASSLMPGPDGASHILALPHGLVAYDNLPDALEAASATGKKVFVDITGHGCVNCREMEARVWSDPAVLEKLREGFVIVALYVDDKTTLPESEWVTTPSGRVLKDVGRVNSNIAIEQFGVNAQPNYFILAPDGTRLAGPRGYNLDIQGFLNFLEP